MKPTRNWWTLLVLAGLLQVACGLYEDQIGKFDW